MHLPAGLVNAMTLRLLTRVRVLTQFLTLTGRRRRRRKSSRVVMLLLLFFVRSVFAVV